MNSTRRRFWPRWWPVALAASLGPLLAAALIPRAADREPVYHGRPLRDWVKGFDTADNAAHNQALAALRTLGSNAVPCLSKDLCCRDSMFVRAVRRIAHQAPWIKVNLDAAERRRIHAVELLGAIGPAARTAVPALIQIIAGVHGAVPPAIAERALLDIGSDSAPPLIEALTDEATAVREFAAGTLFVLIEDRGISETSQQHAVAPLVKMLRDTNPRQRRLAAATLGRIATHARPAVPALIAALQDAEPGVRAQAALALGEIGVAASDAIVALVGLLADAAAPVRENAAFALGRFGPAARQAAPALARSLADDDEAVRVNTANALGRIGVATGPVVPALIDRLLDRAPLVRASAATALGKFGPTAGAAAPALIDALQDDDGQVRRDAAKSLGKLGPAAIGAISALTTALRDDQNSVRICSIEALGEIGPAARAAIPALLKAQVNDYAGIGRYVTGALKKIDPAVTGKQAALSSEGD
ncbi:MAG: HEAT repeat domain-containing protein [Limisphaerales bacterium]